MAETATSIELKTMLGTEIPGAWVKFMDRVFDTMPFLASRGRPSTEQIKNSEIGAAGCSSWKQYVHEVLDWNYSTWNAWNRAYALIQKHEYLRDLKLNSSQINSLYNDTKGDFPATESEYRAYQDAAAEAKRQLEEANIKSLKAEITRLQEELQTSRSEALEAREKLLNQEAAIAKFNAIPWYRKPFFRF